MTVTFAVPEAWKDPLAALASTAYVPGGVPMGPVLLMVAEADCPGLRVTAAAEKPVGQLTGCEELRLNELDAHPAASLLVTEIA